MNIRKQVGINLRRARIARAMSQQALSFEAGVALNYLSGIERGKKNPTLKILAQLAKALRILPAVLFADPPDNTPPPKNLPRGRNVHHRGRKPPKAKRRS